jgi:hypothetical protein
MKRKEKANWSKIQKRQQKETKCGIKYRLLLLCMFLEERWVALSTQKLNQQKRQIYQSNDIFSWDVVLFKFNLDRWY